MEWKTFDFRGGRTKTDRKISQIYSLMSMKELSSKARFEIGYTHLLYKPVEEHGRAGFFTHSSCRITAEGKSLLREQEI